MKEKYQENAELGLTFKKSLPRFVLIVECNF